MTGIEARPTSYKGILMRSRLEADYAAHLDREGTLWQYEPDCFASDEGQWLPDFRTGWVGTLVELKSAHLLELGDGEGPEVVIDRVDAILKRMSIAWSSEPDAWLELAFWTYGASEPVLSVLRSPKIPWAAYTPANRGFPLLWSGMGQMRGLLPSRTVLAVGEPA